MRMMVLNALDSGPEFPREALGEHGRSVIRVEIARHHFG
jgi:hypothetical protein